MRYVSLISFLFTLVFANSLYAAEKLNILGLTLDMTIEELYKKIEPHKNDTGAISHKHIDENDTGGGYGFILMAGEDEMIAGAAPAPQYDQTPLNIMRIISAHSGDEYIRRDVVDGLIKKFGEPTLKNFNDYNFDARGQVGNILIWGSNHVRKDPICGRDKRYTNTSFLNYCDAYMQVDLGENMIVIMLYDQISSQKYEGNFEATRKRPKL